MTTKDFPLRAFLIAVAAAALFTVALNAWSICDWVAGRLTTASLNDHMIDERYYVATIAKVGGGAPALGHSSYREHRDDAYSINLAPVLEGLLMRTLRLSLPATLFLGDLLFPFLAIFLLALGLRRLCGGSAWLAAAAALTVGGELGGYWLRASNPQVPLVAVAAWLAVALSPGAARRTELLLRGALLGLLLWLHPVYASFFVMLDGTIVLADLIAHRSLRRFFVEALMEGAAFGVVLLPRLFLSVPPDIAQDTFHRLGILHTHLPVSPSLQLVIVCALAILLAFRWRAGGWPSPALRRCFLLVAGSLLAFNQALLHGIDAVFVAYYPHLLWIVLVLGAAGLGVAVMPRPAWRRMLAFVVAVVFLTFSSLSVAQQTAQARVDADRYEASDAPAVLDWLRSRSGSLVIAAPRALNERIPYETSHYVLFNEYGWNQPLTDRELAERYALRMRLLPGSVAHDDTYTVVFGGYAGLTAAKRRTFCRIKRSLFATNDPCDVRARSLIRHQELLPIVDELRVDVAETLRRYHVTYVVSEGRNVGPEVKEKCKEEKVMGEYVVWGCGVGEGRR